MKKKWFELDEDLIFIGHECWDMFLKNESLEYRKEQPFHDYRTWVVDASGVIYEFDDNFDEDNIPYRRYLSTYKDDIDKVMKQPFSDVAEALLFNIDFNRK